MAISQELTQDELKKFLRYDAETGFFTWIRSVGARSPVGGKAGRIRSDGYRRIGIFGKVYAEHRLVWFYVHGAWPRGQIDHINGDRVDNRLSNLRDVSSNENMQNRRRAHRNSSTGVLGVRVFGKKFIAQISLGGRVVYLGMFQKLAEAEAAYLNAKRSMHPGCTI